MHIASLLEGNDLFRFKKAIKDDFLKISSAEIFGQEWCNGASKTYRTFLHTQIYIYIYIYPILSYPILYHAFTDTYTLYIHYIINYSYYILYIHTYIHTPCPLIGSTAAELLRNRPFVAAVAPRARQLKALQAPGSRWSGGSWGNPFRTMGKSWGKYGKLGKI